MDKLEFNFLLQIPDLISESELDEISSQVCGLEGYFGESIDEVKSNVENKNTDVCDGVDGIFFIDGRERYKYFYIPSRPVLANRLRDHLGLRNTFKTIDENCVLEFPHNADKDIFKALHKELKGTSGYFANSIDDLNGLYSHTFPLQEYLNCHSGYFIDDEANKYRYYYPNLTKDAILRIKQVIIGIEFRNGLNTNRSCKMIDFGQIIQMKMLKSMMKDDKCDLDIGNLMLMQSITNGEKLQISDVMKAKLVSKFNLDGNADDLPIEKLMFLQMLENKEIDFSQLITYKMLSTLFDEKDDSKKKD